MCRVSNCRSTPRAPDHFDLLVVRRCGDARERAIERIGRDLELQHDPVVVLDQRAGQSLHR
jgi:hypothetical protein